MIDYCPGGELYRLLAKYNKLEECHVRFYTAQILLGLQHLHDKNVIYWDLKPENVIIDQKGYIKLTDFGLSKQDVTEVNPTFSFKGTPEYLAPEVI